MRRRSFLECGRLEFLETLGTSAGTGLESSTRFLGGVGRDVVKSALDLSRDCRADWEMSSLRLESVLVSDIPDGDWGAVGCGVLEVSLGSDGRLVILVHGSRGSVLCHGDSVFGFVRVVVRTIGRNVLGLAKDRDGWLLLSGSDGREGKSQNLKKSRKNQIFRNVIDFFFFIFFFITAFNSIKSINGPNDIETIVLDKKNPTLAKNIFQIFQTSWIFFPFFFFHQIFTARNSIKSINNPNDV